MNCKKCQTKILESLALSKDVALEVAAHQQSCAACAAFYREQQGLFRRIDTGLQSLVNQPAPPSLLPRVRAGLPTRQSVWWNAWGMTAVAAAAILALAIGYASHRPHAIANSAQMASIAPHRSVALEGIGDNAKMQLQPQAHTLPASKHRNAAREVSRAASSEVIVSAEERRALAAFVAEVPENTLVSVAFAQPSQAETEDSIIEIALLEIKPLQVKPLEGTVGQ